MNIILLGWFFLVYEAPLAWKVFIVDDGLIPLQPSNQQRIQPHCKQTLPLCGYKPSQIKWMVSVSTHNIDVVITIVPTIANRASIDSFFLSLFLLKHASRAKRVEERRPHELLLPCLLGAILGLKFQSLPNLKTQVSPQIILYVVERHIDLTTNEMQCSSTYPSIVDHGQFQF